MNTFSTCRKPTRSTRNRGDPKLRFALRLQSLLSALRPSADPVDDAVRHLLSTSDSLRQLWKQASAARRRGWEASAAIVLQNLPAVTEQLREKAASLLRLLHAVPPPPLIPTVRDLLAELSALREEFGDVQIDSHLNVLSVLTEPIELEGLYLGPFRIELHLVDLRTKDIDASAFRCVATDPHPAASCDATTHPHVRDNMPCLGEAVVPIRSSLRAGRLADAFLAVQAVLQTYNSGSPYIALDEWEGRSCGDCGRQTSGDDLYHCEACGSEYCDGCSGHCNACGAGACMQCLDRAEGDLDLCPDCRGCCSSCDSTVSNATLDKQDGLCTACFENEDLEEDEEVEDSSPTNQTPLTLEIDHGSPVNLPAETKDVGLPAPAVA